MKATDCSYTCKYMLTSWTVNPLKKNMKNYNHANSKMYFYYF